MRREQQQKRNFCGVLTKRVVFLGFDRLSRIFERDTKIVAQQKEKEDGVIHDDDDDDDVEMRGLQTSRLRM